MSSYADLHTEITITIGYWSVFFLILLVESCVGLPLFDLSHIAVTTT